MIINISLNSVGLHDKSVFPIHTQVGDVWVSFLGHLSSVQISRLHSASIFSENSICAFQGLSGEERSGGSIISHISLLRVH